MNDSRPHPAATSWWRRPICMGLLGLALMVGGWKLSGWVQPTTTHEQDQQEKLAELKRIQGDPQWRAKVDGYARSVQRQPPFETAGRLVIFAGLAVFIIAGVRMYQAPVREEDENDSERENDYSRVGHDDDGTSPS
jgi:hypothetical protein